MAQCYQHQARSVEILLDMAEEFAEHHPDYTEFMQAIGQSIFVNMGFIEDVCKKAWGYFPENIETWLK